ncbi:MAG: twin-arginine translocase TatA/TatE family subunit [ANME-2 cluster archaeon]|nr:twin-arginine translocase TatA/TatE family subunit [ANME-2 cluster archaeon]
MIMPGPTELLLIFLVILLLFGATKLPELANALGRSTGEFKKAQKESEISLKALDKSEKPKEKPKEISKLQQSAENLGISIEGKTDDQLLDEIEQATKK